MKTQLIFLPTLTSSDLSLLRSQFSFRANLVQNDVSDFRA